MGMFDNVNFEMNCPKCWCKVKGFQSKDANCTLDTIDPVAVDTFYSSCPECCEWIELSRNEPRVSEVPRETPFSLAEVLALGFSLVIKKDA